MNYIDLYGTEESKIEGGLGGRSVRLTHVLAPLEDIRQSFMVHTYLRAVEDIDDKPDLFKAFPTSDNGEVILIDGTEYINLVVTDFEPIDIPIGRQLFVSLRDPHTVRLAYVIL